MTNHFLNKNLLNVVRDNLVKYDGEECALVLARDISDKKEAERLKEDIERITRHDLKTPLNGIIGLPEVLRMDDNLTREQREYLDYIQNAGYRMLAMIDMTLSLYKMEHDVYWLTIFRGICTEDKKYI